MKHVFRSTMHIHPRLNFMSLHCRDILGRQVFHISLTSRAVQAVQARESLASYPNNRVNCTRSRQQERWMACMNELYPLGPRGQLQFVQSRRLLFQNQLPRLPAAAACTMPPLPPGRHVTRGPRNELHKAVRDGSAERTEALLATGSINVNQGDDKGVTPLIVAAGVGNLRVVKILLDRGADALVVTDEGVTALHFSSGRGHLAIVKMLLKAGADAEGKSEGLGAPLHMAAEKGHWEVMRALIEAGGSPDSQRVDGRTPLFLAAQNGHVDAVREPLRANANPLLPATNPAGCTYIALDIAAELGYVDVVRELLQQLRIEGCGGASGGVNALKSAAKSQHISTMAVLIDAGVWSIQAQPWLPPPGSAARNR